MTSPKQCIGSRRGFFASTLGTVAAVLASPAALAATDSAFSVGLLNPVGGFAPVIEPITFEPDDASADTDGRSDLSDYPLADRRVKRAAAEYWRTLRLINRAVNRLDNLGGIPEPRATVLFNRWDARFKAIEQPHCRARRRLIWAIFACNGCDYDVDADTMPAELGVLHLSAGHLYVLREERYQPGPWGATLHVFDVETGEQLNNEG